MLSRQLATSAYPLAVLSCCDSLKHPILLCVRLQLLHRRRVLRNLDMYIAFLDTTGSFVACAKISPLHQSSTLGMTPKFTASSWPIEACAVLHILRFPPTAIPPRTLALHSRNATTRVVAREEESYVSGIVPDSQPPRRGAEHSRASCPTWCLLWYLGSVVGPAEKTKTTYLERRSPVYLRVTFFAAAYFKSAGRRQIYGRSTPVLFVVTGFGEDRSKCLEPGVADPMRELACTGRCCSLLSLEPPPSRPSRNRTEWHRP